MDQKIKKIVRDIMIKNSSVFDHSKTKKNPKKEKEELKKTHDLLTDGIFKFINLTSVLNSNLSKEEKTQIDTHIKKINILKFKSINKVFYFFCFYFNRSFL